MPPYDEIVKENSSLKAENAVLKGQIAWYQRDKFGPGKSETLDRAQTLMKLEGLTTKAEPLLGRAWINRDLAWLEFNRRVLAEAADARTPLPASIAHAVRSRRRTSQPCST